MSEVATVGFAEALRWWLRLGFISFGGPAGQIAVMHQELVVRRRWISENRFLHALNFCMVLPGPEAQQLATYLGWLMHGVKGGIAAGALFVLPSLAILIALSWIYVEYGQVPAIAGVLYGIKPAVTAIVAQAAWRIGGRALKRPAKWAIAAGAFAAALAHLPFPAIIAAAALAGAAAGRRWPAAAHAKATDAPGAPALIGDDTPVPAHARYTPQRLALFLATGLGLWSIAMGGLIYLDGTGALANMGLFFSKAALLTFGGAYAVLPYVVQAAVAHGWASATQMIDGLALGETTPGPLIMIVAFVGYVGAGAAGALVATFFTFLPSFVFIFVFGPLVEATHGEAKFTAPLAGITAAVVGVILNLALFFAASVLWPRSWQGGFEWPALAIGLAAGYALFRRSAGVIPVIFACAVAGLALRLLQVA